jgi:hypothetical protein
MAITAGTLYRYQTDARRSIMKKMFNRNRFRGCLMMREVPPCNSLGVGPDGSARQRMQLRAHVQTDRCPPCRELHQRASHDGERRPRPPPQFCQPNWNRRQPARAICAGTPAADAPDIRIGAASTSWLVQLHVGDRLGIHRAEIAIRQGETTLSDQNEAEASVRELVFMLCLVVAFLVFHVIGWW